MARSLGQPVLIDNRAGAGGGIEVRVGGPQQFAALIRTDLARWSAVVKRPDVKMD